MTDNIKICGLILAAGLSSRMGDFKPLLPLRGRTMIENTVDSMLLGGAERIVIVTGYHAEEVEALLHRRYPNQVITIRNEQYAVTDMMHSIRLGCEIMPPCEAFFLLPCDMPVVEPSTFRRLLEDRPTSERFVLLPTLEGHRKHPPLISRKLIPEILEFHEDGGLRQLWIRLEDIIFTKAVDDEGVWIDLDTGDDYRKCKEMYENTKQEVV